jgi:TRAP-type C4-dicarboxylate transport system permease small subunit
MKAMLELIDRVGVACSRIAGWLFFTIGLMITYEVVARYVFNAPTIWAEEMSRFFQVWAVYLGAAYVLRYQYLIRITLLIDRIGPLGRRLAEAFSLVVIGGVCVVAIAWGIEIVAESVRLGRTTSTMLDVPQWTTELAIPVGCGLLLLQCLAQLVRLASTRDVDTGRIEEQL